MEREKIVQPEKSESLLDKMIRDIFGNRNAFEQRVRQAVKDMKAGGSDLSECDFTRYVIGNANVDKLSEKEFAIIKREIKRAVERGKKGEQGQGQDQERNNVNKNLTFHIPGSGEKIVTEEMKKEARIAEEDGELIGEGFDPEDVRKDL